MTAEHLLLQVNDDVKNLCKAVGRIGEKIDASLENQKRAEHVTAKLEERHCDDIKEIYEVIDKVDNRVENLEDLLKKIIYYAMGAGAATSVFIALITAIVKYILGM